MIASSPSAREGSLRSVTWPEVSTVGRLGRSERLLKQLSAQRSRCEVLGQGVEWTEWTREKCLKCVRELSKPDPEVVVWSCGGYEAECGSAPTRCKGRHTQQRPHALRGREDAIEDLHCTLNGYPREPSRRGLPATLDFDMDSKTELNASKKSCEFIPSRLPTR